MRRTFVCVGIGWLILAGSAAGETHRIQAFPNPDAIAALAPLLPSDLEPTLPAPVLVHEPEFTWGLSNTLHWSSDSVRKKLAPPGTILLFFEIQARFSNQELWGFVNPDVDSATFHGLPEGVKIEYRLRYYAIAPSGTHLLSAWSAAEYSVQDARTPTLDEWTIAGLQRTTTHNWVVGQNVSLRVKATDSFGGKIQEVVVHERSAHSDSTMYFDITPPQSNLDAVFPYRIRSPAHIPIDMSLWVVDVSGHTSAAVPLAFFWWPADEGENRMVCFPNPFNPDRGQVSTIKTDLAGLTEARIFDPFGSLVKVLQKSVDHGFFEWDGKNDRGNTVSNGAYLCVARGDKRMYCKIVVLK